LDAVIKWPNDLVVDGRKVCGILTEMNAEPDYIHDVMIGIGINANQTEFPEELPHAYSLAMAAGHPFSRASIIARVWECFEEDYAVYQQHGNLHGLKAPYERYLANLHQAVRVLSPSGEWEGVAEGIDDSGDLLVREKDGELRAVNSGEVSVRGIYGYV
jgi:BirA family biotin operon repressor/biotin-[acetyl-CoA-carboxylase] ligase